MAKAHVYVRVQVESSNERVQAITVACAALESAIKAAGGEWRGDIQTELDPVKPIVYESKPEVSKEKIIRSR